VSAKKVNTTFSLTLLQQSEITNYQATLATAQGKTVMAFTFATVLFVSCCTYLTAAKALHLLILPSFLCPSSRLYSRWMFPYSSKLLLGHFM
jgi:hypothetical protein